MDILIHSSFFIGTYTSNVSRIVPLYVGFEKSLSLDAVSYTHLTYPVSTCFKAFNLMQDLFTNAAVRG